MKPTSYSLVQIFCPGGPVTMAVCGPVGFGLGLPTAEGFAGGLQAELPVALQSALTDSMGRLVQAQVGGDTQAILIGLVLRLFRWRLHIQSAMNCRAFAVR